MELQWIEPSSAEPWEPEQLLMDRYRVKDCVRQSSTCHLYRVQDVFRATSHLVIRPSPRIMAREGWKEWFEAYCQNALSVPPHPSVLTAERMTQEGEMSFLIMENAEGQGWDSLIFDGTLVELPRMLDVALQVAQGLAWLHSHGRIHYNVKPANVLVSDSGIAKVWKYGEPDAKTRAYASPEQLAADQPLTEATDVWSWAASVLHMFAGKVVWRTGASAPAGLQHYAKKGPAMPKIALMPGALAQLLSQCFKSDPAQRLVTMDEVVETLKAICDRAASSRGRAAPVAAPAEEAAEDLIWDDEAFGADLIQDEPQAQVPPMPDQPPPAQSDQPPPSKGTPKRFHRSQDEQRPSGRRRYGRP